jgi:hypothetical protein
MLTLTVRVVWETGDTTVLFGIILFVKTMISSVIIWLLPKSLKLKDFTLYSDTEN